MDLFSTRLNFINIYKAKTKIKLLLLLVNIAKFSTMESYSVQVRGVMVLQPASLKKEPKQFKH